jgi:hypothetical protein
VAAALTLSDFLTGPGKAFLEVVMVGDALMRRSDPLLSHRDLTAYLDGCVRRPGIRQFMRAFAQMRPGTDSLRETWLRLVVVDAGLPVPDVNTSVHTKGRRGLRYLDLSWERWRIDLEYHGMRHFEDPGYNLSDKDRRVELQEAGWIVIEVTSRDLMDPEALIVRILKEIARAEGLVGPGLV